MSIDIYYFKKIQNSFGVENKIDKQVYAIKNQELKHFNDTYGTKEVEITTSNYDENHKLIKVIQDLIFIKQSDFNVKKIISKPNETFRLGDIIKALNTYYMVTEIDANDEIHTVGKMKRCNTCFKWQDRSGNIIMSYGIIADAVTSSGGVDESKTMSIVDSKTLIWLPLNEDTVLLKRDKRMMVEMFDMEDENSREKKYRELMIENDCPMSIYKITKRNSVEKTYDGYGYISFTYSEIEYDPNKDRTDLMLCDYFEPNTDTPTNNPTVTGSCEITYKSNPTIKCGGNAKKFNCVFKDDIGNIVVFPNNVKVKWTIESTFEENKLNIVKQDDYITFKVTDESLIDDMFKLTLSDEDGIYGEYSLTVDISSIY